MAIREGWETAGWEALTERAERLGSRSTSPGPKITASLPHVDAFEKDQLRSPKPKKTLPPAMGPGAREKTSSFGQEKFGAWKFGKELGEN